MCDQKFRIGYEACVREEAIDMLMDGNSKALTARTMGITYPTISKWLNEYRQAGTEIELHVGTRTAAPSRRVDDFFLEAQLCGPWN